MSDDSTNSETHLLQDNNDEVLEREMMPEDSELEHQKPAKMRVIVLGKSGTGKSSLCNQLVRKEIEEKMDESSSSTSSSTPLSSSSSPPLPRSSIGPFRVGSGLTSITTQCQQETVDKYDCHLTIVDTPSTDSTDNRQMISELKRQATEAGDKTILVFVVRSDARFAAEEYNIYKDLKKNWGDPKDFCRRLIVVFTHGETLGEEEPCPLTEKDEDRSPRKILTPPQEKVTVEIASKPSKPSPGDDAGKPEKKKSDADDLEFQQDAENAITRQDSAGKEEFAQKNKGKGDEPYDQGEGKETGITKGASPTIDIFLTQTTFTKTTRELILDEKLKVTWEQLENLLEDAKNRYVLISNTCVDDLAVKILLDMAQNMNTEGLVVADSPEEPVGCLTVLWKFRGLACCLRNFTNFIAERQ